MMLSGYNMRTKFPHYKCGIGCGKAAERVDPEVLQFGQTTEYGRKHVPFDKTSGSAIIAI